MTFEISAAILLVVLISGVALCVYAKYAQVQIDRLASYDDWTTKFYASAKRVLEYENAPSDWADAIGDLNDLIREKTAARVAYGVFLRRLRGEAQKPGGFNDEEKAFMAKHPGVDALFFEALMAGIISITYTNSFWGVKTRAILGDLYGRNKRPVPSARELKEIVEGTHIGHHGQLAAAA